MVNLDKKDSTDPGEIFMNIIIKSSLLALIFTVPSLAIFLGIYYSTGDIIVGAILGFGFHFVTLAFSGRISKWLVKIQK